MATECIHPGNQPHQETRGSSVKQLMKISYLELVSVNRRQQKAQHLENLVPVPEVLWLKLDC